MWIFIVAAVALIFLGTWLGAMATSGKNGKSKKTRDREDDATILPSPVGFGDDRDDDNTHHH